MRINNNILKVINKSKTIPSVIYFEDDEGNALGDGVELLLSDQQKILIASIMIDQKQSLETIITRMISRGLKLANKNEL